MKTLYTLNEATELINKGEKLLISGDEKVLSKLPKGNWIGGSIPYFMSEQGGLLTQEQVQIVTLSNQIKNFKIKTYAKNELKNIPTDYFANGFSYIIIPAFSECHSEYAENCTSYPGLFDKPLIGWISGINLAELGKTSPKIYNGLDLSSTSEKTIVMHLELEDKFYAKINIINLFKQGSGDTITFSNTSFKINECTVNGEKTNLAEYITSKKIDTKLPLVANYLGAMINVSFQNVNLENKTVDLYAPVFPGVEYKIAMPVENYEGQFQAELNKSQITPFFSCNCILNYLYANLENKKTGHITGPMTFGEIAYMLLNQTMVYLTIESKF